MNNNYTKFLSLFFILFIFFSVRAQNPALSFDGTNDFVQTTYSGISGNSNRTIEAWIKITANSNPSAGGIQHVITDWGTFTTGSRFTFCVLWNNAIRIEVGGNGLSGTIAVNDGNWHHVAVSYNSSLASNQYSLYVDGVLDVSGNLTVATNTGTSIDMRISQRVDGINPFDGEIDEVRVYNFAKTQAQIVADKDEELCTIPAGLVAYYRLNEGIPSGANTLNASALDYSGGGNTGILNGFALNGTSSNWTTGPVLVPGNTFSTFNITDCSSYTSPSGSFTWTSSGTYTDVIPNSFACDSIMRINLTIGDASSSISPSACTSYTSPKGDVYTSSANFIDTLVGAGVGGCDSIITVNLTIGAASSSIDTVVCDSYISPSGHNVTITSIFNDTLFNASSLGCDSIISLDVKVYYSDSTNSELVSCEDSVMIAGTWYFTDQTVVINAVTSNGCDSTHTLDLSFSSPTFEAINISSCGPYTSPLGQVYTSSSIFAETYSTSAGCDSIIEYTLMINSGSSETNSISACDSLQLNGNWYFSSQTISNTYTDNNGCDSTVITNLNVSTISGNEISEANDGTLSTIIVSGANYEWFDCETNIAISGANTNSFTPTQPGSYSVVITSGNCTSTSECFDVLVDGINEVFNEINISIEPNPNTGNFKVSISEDNEIENYEIVNIIGKTVYSKNVNSRIFYINEEMPKGLYFIKVNSKNGAYLKQFVVR